MKHIKENKLGIKVYHSQKKQKKRIVKHIKERIIIGLESITQKKQKRRIVKHIRAKTIGQKAPIGTTTVSQAFRLKPVLKDLFQAGSSALD